MTVASPPRIETHSSRPVNAGAGSKADAILLEYGALFASAVGAMIKAVGQGEDKRKARKKLMPAFNDRQAASAAFHAAGMVDSRKERLPGEVEEAEIRLEAVAERIRKGEAALADMKLPFAKKGGPEKIALLEKRLAGQRLRLEWAEESLARKKRDLDEGNYAVCLGSKRLFRRQFHLAENGYAGHAAWLEDWRSARSSNILLMGCRTETSGCQIAQAVEKSDGSFDLLVRLPPALEKLHGRHLRLTGLRFKERKGRGKDHGAAALSQALARHAAKDGAMRKAVSWRLTRDAKGWRCSFTTETPKAPIRVFELAGCLGVDVNAAHLACCLTDPSGNPVGGGWDLPLDLKGLSSEQAADAVGKAALAVARTCLKAGVPCSVEKLDFAKKKAGFYGKSKKYKRMLSAFATRKILSAIQRACEKLGVEVREVDPAYTSVIGGRKIAAGRISMNVHRGAACAIARRARGFSEKPSGKDLAQCPRVASAGPKGKGSPPEDGARFRWLRFWQALSRKKAVSGPGQAACVKKKRASSPGHPIQRQARTDHARRGETQSPESNQTQQAASALEQV